MTLAARNEAHRSRNLQSNSDKRFLIQAKGTNDRRIGKSPAMRVEVHGAAHPSGLPALRHEHLWVAVSWKDVWATCRKNAAQAIQSWTVTFYKKSNKRLVAADASAACKQRGPVPGRGLCARPPWLAAKGSSWCCPTTSHPIQCLASAQ